MFFFGAGHAWRPHHRYSAVPPEGGAAPVADALPQSDGASAGVLDELSGALASARATLSNILDLISCEARRAGLALMWMVALGLVAAICIAAAWLGLMAALAMWAISLGLPPLAAVIATAVINCMVGAALIYVCIGMSHDLLFSATRRQVGGDLPGKRSAP